MNWKKAVTIGLLSITAIGLVGCAVILSKNNPNAKPKVQTNATYSYTSFWEKDNHYNFNIIGTLEIPENTLYYDDSRFIINGQYYINIWENDYHRYASLFLKPTNIARGENNGDTADYTEFIYFDNVENPGIRMGDLEISKTKEFKNIVIQQRLVDYVVETTCDIKLQLSINWTDNTNTTSNFNEHSLLDLITTDDFEIDFTDSNNYTRENIPVTNTLTALADYYEDSTPYQDGFDAGEQIGYNEGYADGYQMKGDLADGNFLSLRDTMLSVLTMPFTFINKAFDVTLWEGTAYAFNISNFIKGMIAIAAILFIIRLFTSGFSIIGNYTGGITNSRLDRKQKQANIEYTKAKTANVGKPKEIHSTSEHTNTSHIYTHKEK